MSNKISCSEEFLESVKSLGIESSKYNAIIELIDQKYHRNYLDSQEPIPGIAKVVLKMMRMSTGKKLDNFSSPFLIKLMDIDPTKEQLYGLLEIVDKTYNKSQTNDLTSKPKNN